MRKFGTTGFCKLCNWGHEPELNKKIADGNNAAQCLAWAKQKYGFTFSRQTFYTHRDHLNSAEKVVGFKERPAGERAAIRRSSNREFLEKVRDIALANVEADPAAITVEQGLKAASILEQSKQKQSEITLILAQVVTGHRPDVLIEAPAAPPMIVEGIAREVEPVV